MSLPASPEILSSPDLPLILLSWSSPFMLSSLLVPLHGFVPLHTMPATAHTKLVLGNNVPIVVRAAAIIAIINKEVLLYIIPGNLLADTKILESLQFQAHQLI